MIGIKKFYCKICNNGIVYTRKGIREHIGTEHRRNAYFQVNNKTKEDINIRREEWKP